MFIIIEETNIIVNGNDTAHISERSRRVNEVERLLIEEKAKPIKAYTIDKGHKNGFEIHVIYNNGVVRIYNKRTHKHITDLFAREPQITRYGITVTKTMRKKIRRHVNTGLNHMY